MGASRKNKGVRNGRQRIFRASNYRCYYCGIQLTKQKQNGRTIDHLIPLSKGGLTIDENLVGCCQQCNCEKDNRDLNEYRAYIKTKYSIKSVPKFWGEGGKSGKWLRSHSKIIS